MSFLKRFFKNLSITNWIILIDIVFFILVLIAFSSSFNADNSGAGNITNINNPDFISKNIAFSWNNLVEGRIWTLVTSMFMHANFEHIFFNMFSLFFIGNFIEKLIGRRRFLLFYLIAGVFAAIIFGALSLIPYPMVFSTSGTAAVGASGAIFGLLGLLAVITPKGRVYLLFGPLIAVILQLTLQNFISGGIFYLISFLITLYIFASIFTMFSFNPRTRKIALPVGMPFWLLPIIAIVPLVIIGLFVQLPIGNTAHLGGLLAGLIYGLYLRMKYKKKVEVLNRMLERRR